MILHVDDDESDAFLLRRALRKLDPTLQYCWLSTADEAFAYLAGEGQYGDRTQFPLPTLLLLDNMMPGRRSTGELADWMRTQPHLAPIPLVTITGELSPADQAQWHARGVVAVLYKGIAACPGIAAQILELAGKTNAEIR